ncbi:3-hydroxyacyl-CoA dehydrogenase [Gordonia terrae]|uniref:3-hydroxyacyl-CoA dehydrogenase n=2 Tax=Gordonia terrae TaxID=2055 RepID=A0AAD0NWP9_9ACTN|nr:3-hydroxyacyl-CoA dehydrogenase [Gordonia terrae]VTR09536.1 3-hydroxyacyl-CoA dehydrogenase [Clostridioides difficile]ANY22158.1 3-hydroxybutyryl-CoA dehydrogenase [Gordonia terrae]AWO82898.1 3-hydroxyacyl-CoA dehydrogenase [Gordonia terrae]VTS28710.1 Fatty acid oxidation complex subunit alpha [Gordonia terrae]GAB46390.1 putative 3-hydroxyacyl-CoA dehydrogenase [Gordonia terrae NBRC 100016]
MSQLNEVTILGSGLLGSQIAWHSAYKGKTVVVYDIAEQAIARCQEMHDQYATLYTANFGASNADIAATRARLSYGTHLAEAVANAALVIEAVPEVPDVKTAVYEELADLLPEDALVVTNSSTFLPSTFAEATGRPDRFCALHFGNGIWAMNFAEIMAHPSTARATLTAVTEFAIEIGMTPIPVRKEHNGYVVNTWTVALTNAAQTLVTNGISTAEDVDRSFMKFGFPIGPFGLLDQVGMKTAFDILAYWGTVNNDSQMTANAKYIETNFLSKGLLGAQTGQGYYTWPDPSFAAADFLDVPDISEAAEIAALVMP